MKLIMCKGLPGSGKTTWAKEQNAHRINKDDLRAMLNNGVWSKHNEEHIIEVRDILISHFLPEHDVIVDDTNLAPKHEARLRDLAEMFGAKFEVKDFTDVSLESCLERDLIRPNSVGSKVIMKMYDQFLKPKVTMVERVEGLKNAIICDLDGTLCLFGNKNPYTRDFENDEINRGVANLLYRIDGDNFNGSGEWTDIIFTSGRDEKYREVTRKWLDGHGFEIYKNLFMRTTDDKRKDAMVKQEIYDNNIKGKFNIEYVLDDRNQVVDMWRSLGLTVFQVAEGDF